MTAQKKVEEREFRSAPNLLRDVIQKQAGSLSKAVAEGVMNSADAILSEGRTDGYCRITVDETTLIIEDNGKGFRSKKEVLSWFEIFGEKHTAEENKTFGTFRMGRGQLMSYGKNVWRSGKLRMIVDVKSWTTKMSYDLETGLDHHPGCRIEIALYNKLQEYDLNILRRDLGKWFKYAPVPVSINGETVTVDPKTEKWDLDTPEAYVRLRQNDSYLTVYNLGVYVRDEYGYSLGAGGELVSKKQLALNFARNEVLRAECKVWEKVTKAIRTQVDKLVLTGKKLTKDQLTAVLGRAVAGDRVDGFDKLRVVADCNGRRYTVAELRSALAKYRSRVSFAAPGDRSADRLLQTQACLVLDEAVLAMLGATATTFFHKLGVAGGLSDMYFDGASVVPFAQAKSGLEGDQTVLDERAQPAVVQVWMDVARRAMYELVSAGRGTVPWKELREKCERRGRRLLVGASPTCDGWTDGKIYIALNHLFLKEQPFTAQGLTAVGVLIAHEMAHDDATDGTHHHGVEFFEEFEYLCRHGLPQFVSHGLRAMHKSVPLVVSRYQKTFKTDADALGKTRAAFEKAAAELKTVLESPEAVDSESLPAGE